MLVGGTTQPMSLTTGGHACDGGAAPPLCSFAVDMDDGGGRVSVVARRGVFVEGCGRRVLGSSPSSPRLDAFC